jgi:antibiotic biosynthesis monooxygenase (ABM) superfamily enzyme
MTTKHDQLVQMLKKTEEAHHEAFLEVNGEDPEWAAWYAEYMHSEFEALVDQSISVEGIADLITRFDELHNEEEPEEDWPEYYATKLLNFYDG